MSSEIEVRVLYFALLRERLQMANETLCVAAGSRACDLLDLLCARHPAVRQARNSLRVAVNQDFVPPEHVLCEGDEVALIPPVSGGGPCCRLSRSPIGLEEVIAAVSDPGCGGMVTFTGLVRRSSRGRTVLRLQYEAYEPMALRALAALIESIEAARPGVRVAIVHRLGTLAVGETAVVIAAAAPHRDDAFAACREAIERLKQEIPIWKKEITEEGEEWIGQGP
ncbi:MAG: molybdopterin converting factor subunit 1 [Myxococcales bacterium]|nr:molybdopterin converting factor subunit 1 [Myxococcota bacterium]MDW8280623.1 molybdopterin converting factor subunit 1 [Myxococcales bacterium]